MSKFAVEGYRRGGGDAGERRQGVEPLEWRWRPRACREGMAAVLTPLKVGAETASLPSPVKKVFARRD